MISYTLKGFKSIVFIVLTLSSFIYSCGRNTPSTSNMYSSDATVATTTAKQSSKTGIICDTNIYGDACSNLDDFTLVKKEEVKPEYIKSGSSIGGVQGNLIANRTNYEECSEDGSDGCITTDTYKALKLSNHSSKIISSENILGVSGSFVIPVASKVFAGTTYGVEGSIVGSLPYCEGNDSGCYLRSYSQDVNSLKALNYDDLYSKRENIKNGYELVSGVTGNQSLCTAGSTNCYIDGTSLKAAESAKLTIDNIKHGISLGGVTGSYTGAYSDCTGESTTGCIAVSDYPSVPIGITSSLLSSVSINETPGEIEDCSSGDSSCYINGNTYKAAESSALIASNIKKDTVIGGVTGNYPSALYPLAGSTNTTDLVSSNFNSLMVSSGSFEWFDAAGNRYTGTGDSDIVAGNLRNEVNVFGVVGSYGDPLPKAIGVGNSKALALKKKDGTVVCFGVNSYGGNCSGVSGLENVVNVFSSERAFAVLKDDGSVITWGNSTYGGNSSSVSAQISSGVTNISATQFAFAAIKDTGAVVTWGDSSNGGNSSSVSASISSGVTKVSSTQRAFAALKNTGAVVTWGDSSYGGDSSSVSASISSGVVDVFSADRAFAALKDTGAVVTWGSEYYGGNSSSVSAQLTSGVTNIFSTQYAFAAVKDTGAVVTWGDASSGGNSSSVSASISSGVTKVFSTGEAFAALKENGSVVTWGSSSKGGNSSSVSGSISSGVVDIFSTLTAFAALKSDGTVVTWGDTLKGGNSSPVSAQLTGVVNIFSTQKAFAALKSTGTVVTWGDANSGGDISYVETYTGSSVVSNIINIFSAPNFFIGVREDDTYVVWGLL